MTENREVFIIDINKILGEDEAISEEYISLMTESPATKRSLQTLTTNNCLDSNSQGLLNYRMTGVVTPFLRTDFRPGGTRRWIEFLSVLRKTNVKGVEIQHYSPTKLYSFVT